MAARSLPSWQHSIITACCTAVWALPGTFTAHAGCVLAQCVMTSRQRAAVSRPCTAVHRFAWPSAAECWLGPHPCCSADWSASSTSRSTPASLLLAAACLLAADAEWQPRHVCTTLPYTPSVRARTSMSLRAHIFHTRRCFAHRNLLLPHHDRPQHYAIAAQHGIYVAPRAMLLC